MNIIPRAKGILKYKVFVLGTIYLSVVLPFHQSYLAYGMESTVEKHSPLPAAFAHFEEDKVLIHGYLSKVKEAELHFFWTTGRTLSDNPDYHPNTKVDIGGSEYGQKFFPYVDKFLENSPNNLKIKLVCDTMTVKSNEAEIIKLHHKYGNRFEILPIEKVQKNLLKTFSSDSQTKKINLVFKNATQGSPVLTSDIYRVIGMIYGQGHPSNISQTQYTYCDIDAFCYGMENSSHAQLIEALFNPITKTPFYFGMSNNNNDLIKLHVTDMQPYKDFCDRILNKISIDANVLTHFSNLHDMIKRCEKDSQNCSDLISHLPPPIKNLILAVTLATGPKFLYDKHITTNLSYPSTTVGEWGAPEEILDYTMQRHVGSYPPSVLFWGYGEETPEEKKASEAFMRDCDQYRTILAAAFYAKRFGDHHPFNIELKKHLVGHFPYNAPSFKKLLTVNFDIRKSRQSYEEWKKDTFENITKPRQYSKNHYAALIGLLKQLGIEIPFTPDSIDFQAH